MFPSVPQMGGCRKGVSAVVLNWTEQGVSAVVVNWTVKWKNGLIRCVELKLVNDESVLGPT